MKEKKLQSIAAFFVYDTAVGKITVAEDGEAVVLVEFGAQNLPGSHHRSALTDRAAAQLEEYFAGRRQVFDLPLHTVGTPFQRLVWAELQRIPYGETKTYRQVAEATGHPLAFRAVGMANNKNPIAIIIPCHRVIGSDGSLTGYASGLPLKEHLLALEKGQAVALA